MRRPRQTVESLVPLITAYLSQAPNTVTLRQIAAGVGKADLAGRHDVGDALEWMQRRAQVHYRGRRLWSLRPASEVTPPAQATPSVPVQARLPLPGRLCCPCCEQGLTPERLASLVDAGKLEITART
jgi:hypothetical protein